MTYSGWRRFRPTVRTRREAARPKLIAGMHARLDELLSERGGAHAYEDIDRLDGLVEKQVSRVISYPTATEWLTLLILRAPGAARAQHQMDKHPHGYRNQQARLFELIDFNDAFVSTVLALSDDQRRGFIEAVKREIDAFCERVGSRSDADPRPSRCRGFDAEDGREEVSGDP